MLYALAQKALIPVNPNPFRLYLIQTFFLNLKTIPMEWFFVLKSKSICGELEISFSHMNGKSSELFLSFWLKWFFSFLSTCDKGCCTKVVNKGYQKMNEILTWQKFIWKNDFFHKFQDSQQDAT